MRNKLIMLALTLVLLASTHLPSARAVWDCAKYTFNVDASGNVSVNNLGLPEDPNFAEVLVNGVWVAEFAIPALPTGTSAQLGHIDIQVGDHWYVESTINGCWNEGTLHAPPQPPGNTLVCVQLDKGNLWGKLEIWHSNAAGEQLDGFDGYAEINADGAITIFANPGEDRHGYFLVFDEHGVSELFYVDASMTIDCLSPLTWGCQRIYAVQVARDHECLC